MSNVTSESILTTKEIVEQAIQDYHKGILPYLNGQVPTIANKFDKANLYSTDEQIVGRWIDGKPLYQKTIDINVSDMTTEASYLRTYNISNLNIDKPINIEGIFHSNNTYITFDSVSLSDSGFNGNYSAALYFNGKAISLSYQSTMQSRIDKIIVTLQYTKTTDEAIAIGSDTDYSLEEKIIGTWIDGKKLYQNTVSTGTAVPSGATEISRITNGQTGYDTIQYTKPTD